MEANRKAKAVDQTVQREWLSYPDAEQYCGLSRVTLWRLVGSGEIKAARVGRAVRINRQSLQEFMERAAGEGAALEKGGPMTVLDSAKASLVRRALYPERDQLSDTQRGGEPCRPFFC